MTQQATQQNRKNPNQLATTSKSRVTIETSAVNSNEIKTRPKTTRIVPAITTTRTVVSRILTPTITFPTTPTQSLQTIKKTENQDLSTHPVRPVLKLTIPQRSVTLEPTQLMNRLPATDARKERIRSNKKCPKQFSCECLSCSPKFELETPCLYSGAACDRPETNKS